MTPASHTLPLRSQKTGESFAIEGANGGALVYVHFQKIRAAARLSIGSPAPTPKASRRRSSHCASTASAALLGLMSKIRTPAVTFTVGVSRRRGEFQRLT